MMMMMMMMMMMEDVEDTLKKNLILWYVLCFFKNKFIYILAALGLRCCVRAFSSCGERGLLFVAVCGLLIAVALLCCGAQALGMWAAVVAARELSNCVVRGL